MKRGLHILVLLLAMSCPVSASADPARMALQSTGAGSFTLTGERVIGVHAMDIEIEYDSSLLEKPYAMITGGELKQVTTDTPGKLLISVFRPVADANLQIVLKFEAREDRPGGIRHISLSSVKRRTPNQPPEPRPESSLSGGAGDESADGSADVSARRTAGGTIPKADTAVEPDGNAPSTMTGSSFSGGFGRNAHTGGLTALIREEQSVLRRFRKFKGEDGLKAFTALFAGSDENGITQEPQVALSDGLTPVTLKLNLRQKATNSPNLALFDATLVSMRRTDEATMVVTVVPRKGTWEAGLVLETGAGMMEFPLVVAPQITVSNSINEKNFLVALNQYISDHPQAGQGENKSYLYKYIFTANYLAASAR